MVTVLAVLAALIILVTGAAAVTLGERRTALRSRVVVNLGDDAITGLLWARRGRLLVLRDASLLTPGREPTSMDGEVVIDREQVRFVQAIP